MKTIITKEHLNNLTYKIEFETCSNAERNLDDALYYLINAIICLKNKTVTNKIQASNRVDETIRILNFWQREFESEIFKEQK